MKRLVFHLSAIASVLLMSEGYAQAETVSPEAAKVKAIEFLTNGARKVSARRGMKQTLAVQNVELAYTSVKDDKTCFYVYNNGNDGGFVIVGGDDMAKEILAYVPEGHFDYDNAPDNMKWWLGQYEGEIQSGLLKGNQKTPRHQPANPTLLNEVYDSFEDVPDMISTKWGQGEFYNNFTPLDYAGNHCVTGCVPTAMAQIMKYWNYPTIGYGSHTNSWSSNCFADFGNTNYDWSNMLDSYNGSENQEQINAVSTLLYHIGVAVDAQYGSSSSTGVSDDSGFYYKTQIQNAFEYYFLYDNTTRCVCRSATTDEDWACIIYSELKAGRPVCYTGQNDSGQGHAFVCHGYSSSLEMFSFNWGWNGSNDGYYSLSATDGVNGFTMNEAIYTGIQPKGHQASDICYGDAFDYDGYHYFVQNPILKRVAFTCDDTKDRNGYQYDYSGSVTIPSQVRYLNDDYTVTHIGRGAFTGNADYNHGVENITLPTTLLSLGAFAFKGCRIESLDLPEGILKIGPDCFKSMDKIIHLTIPEGVRELPSYCMAFCDKLQSVTLPDSLKSLGEACFAGDDALSSLRIPKGITNLEFFDECGALTFVELPDSISSLHYLCFSQCPSLSVMVCHSASVPQAKSQTFPSSISGGVLYVPKESIEKYKSAPYWNQWGTIEDIDNFVEDPSIGKSFEDEGLIYRVTSNAVSVIGRTISSGHVTIPDSVVFSDKTYPVNNIGYRAFSTFPNRENITSFTLPSTLRYISSDAFVNNVFESIEIPEGVVAIGTNAFSGCNNLKYIHLPSGITRIEFHAFSYCISLEEIDINEGVGFIGSYAFSNCWKLNHIVLPKSLYRIGQCAFENCKELKSMVCLSPKVYTFDDWILEMNPDVFELGDDPKFSEYQSDGTLYVPTEYINNYESYDVWKEWGSIEPIVPLTYVELPYDSICVSSNESYSLSASTGPDDATLTKINWSSSNDVIATVSRKGVVYGCSAGTATIYARSMYYSDLIDSCIVTVTPKSHKIAYVLDGETYQTDNIAVGEAIVLPEEPIKAGYVFTGWEGLPNDSIMPDQDLELTAVFKKLGDPNADGLINITDIVSVISYILEDAPESFIFKAADVNEDGIINITDIVGIIDIILTDDAPANATLRRRAAALANALPSLTTLEIVPFGIEQGTTSATVTLDMLNPDDEFTAFECSIKLPEGIGWAYTTDRRGNIIYTQPTFNKAADRTDANYHTLSPVTAMSDGTYKVICYSMQKAEFLDAEGAILDLPLIFAEDLAEGIYEIEVKDIVLTRKDVTDVKPSDYKATVVVGKPAVKSATIYGDVTADAIAMLNARLGAKESLGSLDLSSAIAVDGTSAITTANPNAVIYVAEGMSVKNESNVVEGDVCANLVLTDGKPFGPAKTFTVKAGEYSRTLSADTYGTIVLPFAPDAETMKGYTFYELTDVETNALTFDEVSSPVAGKPYIVTSDGTATKMGAEAESTVVIEPAATEADGWTMTGTYESVVFTDTDELASLYCISGNQFKQATSKLTMNPFRAYFVGDGSVNSITLRGDDGTTNIISLNSQSSILNSPLYDLQGRQVEHAEQGIYIQNGKKVLVK